jgi:hypothetical protein
MEQQKLSENSNSDIKIPENLEQELAKLSQSEIKLPKDVNNNISIEKDIVSNEKDEKDEIKSHDKSKKRKSRKNKKNEDNSEVELEIKPKKTHLRKDGRKNVSSIFHIMINTNKVFREPCKELNVADKNLQNAIEFLFHEEKNYKNILKINPRQLEKYQNDTYSPQFIKKVTFNGYGTEISPTNKRLT